MNVIRKALTPIAASLIRSVRLSTPAFARYRIGVRQRLKRKTPPQTRQTAITEAVSWLYRSLDVGPEDGSRCFRVASGWSAPYPEVTGYNLYTLLDHFQLSGSEESRNRARRMGNWLLTIQMDGGAFQGGYLDQPAKPVVFNTAQVLQGLVRLHRETGDPAFLEAAQRAGNWLVEVQDPDGAWRRYCYLGVFRVTDARIAFPLAELWKATGESRYRDAASRSLQAVLRFQLSNGWFSECDNSIQGVDQPITHTIAYTTEGLIEGGLLLGEESFVASGRRCADAMLRRFEIDRALWGRYDSRWRGTVKWTCLTGCAQTARNWLSLYRHTGDPSYLNAALKMNDYLCCCQDVRSTHPGVRGALAGSEPFRGGYQSCTFPSWATKYFVDALLAEKATMDRSRGRIPDEADQRRGAS